MLYSSPVQKLDYLQSYQIHQPTPEILGRANVLKLQQLQPEAFLRYYSFVDIGSSYDTHENSLKNKYRT